MAMPAAMRIVIPYSSATPWAPRRAEAAAVRKRPRASVRTGPNLATSTEPGTAASANMREGSAVSTPTPDCDRWRSRWIRGMRGGTASTVARRLRPDSQRSPRLGRRAVLLV